jgi:protein N-terminal methyltransferase
MDDMGHFYNSHDELLLVQLQRKEEFYQANATWWNNGGYGGSTDDEVMIGDTDGEHDGEEGLKFLDTLISSSSGNSTTPAMKQDLAVDLGAGVGRISKLVLLKRYAEVRLVEGNPDISKRSKMYLGRKRAARCTFTSCYLQDLNILEWGMSKPVVDLMWIQWTLQYLTDVDVVECLKKLATALRPLVGVLVVKENRPFGTARPDRFQMDTPAGANGRYDITRSEDHHRLLFHQAGFQVDFEETGKETSTFALKPIV